MRRSGSRAYTRHDLNGEQHFFSLIWTVGGTYISPHLASSYFLIVFFLQLLLSPKFPISGELHRSLFFFILPESFPLFFLMGLGPSDIESTMSEQEVEMVEEWFFPR